MRARTRLGSEDGYTLVELLVATAGGLVLMAGVFSLMLSSLYAQSAVSNRISTLQGLQASLVSMTNELRPAYSTREPLYAVNYVTGEEQLGITLTPPTGAPAVTYDCYTTRGTCVRTTGGKPTATLATGVTNSDVFTLECRESNGNLKKLANPISLSGCANGVDYVRIRLATSVPCTGQGNTAACPNKTIEVNSGTSLRNQA